MTTHLHYYGSTFELSADVHDDIHREIVQSNFNHVAEHGPATFWFDLADGGHLSLRLHSDTPLAITTS